MVQIQTDYSNLTRERNELNNSYNNLTEKLEQLQTSYNNLTRERNELNNSYNILSLSSKDDPMRTSHLQHLFMILNTAAILYASVLTLLYKCHCGRWRSFGSKYYYISSEQKTWEESREDCRQKGTDLVIINMISALFSLHRYWLPSQPDNYREEDCAEMKVNVHRSLLKWNDIPCSQNNYWVCETVDV
uniref:C-type lectin domain-containing protein n=1 Tax=Lates calcarifer TaxID=8187 RepID=A0A4W6DRH7_LATCA